MIPRFVENHVYGMHPQLHKAILILGARQVGKTTLWQSLQKRLESQGEAVRYLNCDLEEDLKILVTIVERYKYYLNRGQRVQGRFWRTYGGAEVDYIWKSGRVEEWKDGCVGTFASLNV